MSRLPDPQFWRDRRVFLTGHTGFKGGWLLMWLQQMGARVCGYALPPPTEPSLFVEAGLASLLEAQHEGDIRDADNLARRLQDFQPDTVIHMAAQPLVRLSYREPVATYATNVMGTVHLLEAVRQCPQVRAVLSVTSDKCYENREWPWGYRENEAMGGYDPYSNSKGCAELVTAAYRQSFFQNTNVALASARSGNVIGGGDWAGDRLVPDILAAFSKGEPVAIRNPHAVRPWQHVLEPLNGYLLLLEALHEQADAVAEGWNFGPRDEDARPVGWIVEQLCTLWNASGGHPASWSHDAGPQPHEAHYLKLDISKARGRLGFAPRWSLSQALESIIRWHRAWQNRQDMRLVSLEQIQQYIDQESP